MVIKKVHGINCRKCIKKILDYSKKHDLKLTGYAYEVGLNDFVISNPDDYITKIMIKIEENLIFRV